MRFTINIATKTHLDRRLAKQACSAVLALLLIITAFSLNRLLGDIIELRHIRDNKTDIENRLNSRPAGVSDKVYERLVTSMRFYNEIIERKCHNWLGLFDQLERATPEGIALISLSQDKNATDLKLEGHAKSFSALQSFLEKLENSRAFTNILLQSHHYLPSGDRGKALQFSITCRMVSR